VKAPQLVIKPKLQLKTELLHSFSTSCRSKPNLTSLITKNLLVFHQPRYLIRRIFCSTVAVKKMEADQPTNTNQTAENQNNNNSAEKNGMEKGVVTGLPKKWIRKQLEQLLTSNNLGYVKVKKIAPMSHGEITFDSMESFNKAKAIINNLTVEGKNLRISIKKNKAGAKRPASTEENERLAQKLKTNEDGSPKTINDVVTPLWKTPYEQQLEKKNDEIVGAFHDLLHRIKKDSFNNVPEWSKSFFEQVGGKLELPFPVEKILPSPVVDYYRNKVAFSIGKDLEGKTCVGFNLGRMSDSIDVVADAAECMNVSTVANTIRKSFHEYVLLRQQANPNLIVWDKFNHKGFWRQITVRTYASGENMVILQVNPAGLSKEELETEKQEFVKWYESMKPSIQSLMWQEHSGVSNAAPHDCKCHLLAGSEYVHEVLMGIKFRISPNAFFQTNSKATEVLYNLVKDWCINDAKAATETTVLDVCCGTGTIGLSIAPYVNKVIGVEMQPEAVDDAIVNAKLNNISNATFLAGKAEDVLLKTLKPLEQGECVAIVDPPRSGLHPDVVKALRACSSIKYLIYISCDVHQGLVNNGSALCRVSGHLKGDPFVLVKGASVDLFPHAQGFETVALFRR